jgi:hypothetical protein
MRANQRRSRTIAVLALVLPLLALGGGAEAKKKPPPTPFTGPVPRADCGPNDRVESGLQGQTSLAERASGDSAQGYNCNLELVGQFQGEGANWMMAWRDDCAYYGTLPRPQVQNPGVVVLDASDPRNPQVTDYLTTPAMLNPHESLKVHQKRQLLAGVERDGPGFAIYDVSGDCRHPVLKASIDVPESKGHAGNFTPDGLTYYATQTHRGFHGLMPIIDVSDPSNPKHLLNYEFGTSDGRSHDVSFNKDGTREYAPQPGQFGNFESSVGPNGLVILDVSDIQFRRPNPQLRVISTLFWHGVDGGQAQMTLPVTYHGRAHLIFTDELGSGGAGGRPGACARGVPPDGFARIIDISDERNPKLVSKLMLEVHDPANCPSSVNDPVRGLGYSSHYCNVDKTRNPTMLACSYFEAGLRVFDIRDPFHPREIAYYKPPAQRTAFLPGSNLWAEGRDRTADGTSTQVRFRKHKGETHIWFVSQDNGFQIVRFTKSRHELLGKGKDDDDDGGTGGRDNGRRERDRDDDD